MVAAIALISFVVFRISERDIINQRIQGNEDIFLSIRTSVNHILQNNSLLLSNPSSRSELQQLIKSLTNTTSVLQIIVINTRGTVLAHPDEALIGQNTSDSDLLKVLFSSDLVKRYRSGTATRQNGFTITSPLHHEKSGIAGALKVIFSMQAVEQHIAQSSRFILLYLLVDAVVLILFGTFLLSRYLVKPLNKVISLTENISKGNFDATLYLSDRNEIGRLSASLSQMAERLNDE
jgi:sensor histidine kinase regulating citrate/malate metabolism